MKNLLQRVSRLERQVRIDPLDQYRDGRWDAEFLQSLSDEELERLAAETRKRIAELESGA